MDTISVSQSKIQLKKLYNVVHITPSDVTIKKTAIIINDCRLNLNLNFDDAYDRPFLRRARFDWSF